MILVTFSPRCSKSELVAALLLRVPVPARRLLRCRTILRRVEGSGRQHLGFDYFYFVSAWSRHEVLFGDGVIVHQRSWTPDCLIDIDDELRLLRGIIIMRVILTSTHLRIDVWPH